MTNVIDFPEQVQCGACEHPVLSNKINENGICDYCTEEPQVIRVHIDLPDQPPATAGQVAWQIITGFGMGVVIVSCFVGLMN